MLTSFYACQNHTVENTDTVRDYTLNDFSSIKLDLSKATEVSKYDMIMGAPINLELLNDSIMSIHDVKTENCIWLLNLNTGAYSNCLHKGEGPLESLSISNIYSQDGKLYASPSQDTKMFEIEVDPTTLHPTIKNIGTTPNDIYRSIKISDTEFIYAPFFEDSVRFIKAKINGEVLDTIGNLNFVVSDEEFIPRNNLAQMNIAISQDRSTLVAANMSWNIIEVYDLTHNNSTILRGPVLIDSKVMKVEMPFGSTYKQKPRWKFFKNPSVSSKGFTIGYIGVEISSTEDLEREISSILCFDSNGFPTKQLLLNEEISCYTIDYGTMTLYFIPKDGEPVIKKYDLPLSYDEMIASTK